MIASTRDNCFSSGLFSASCLRLPIPGIIPMMLSSGPIFRIVRSWSRKSSSVKSSCADLLLEALRVFLVDRLFRLLDERQHVAHAEQPRHQAVRVKRLEILEALAAAHEGDRHADDGHHREGGAAARVAVELREHDARDAHAPVELARRS